MKKVICRSNLPVAIYRKWNLLLPLFIFLFLSCEKSEEYFDNPLKFLETKIFPSYFLRIPYYGVNGRNLLEAASNGTMIDVKGVYVKGKNFSFLRVFNDSGLFYMPLEERLTYDSETSLLEVKGKVTSNGEPYLSLVEVVSSEDVGKIKDIVEREYPLFISKIEDNIRNPRSKLNLQNIKSWHLASSDNYILVYGRTYDLMYEFDIGVLLKKDGVTYSLEKIFAREFFKGE